MGMLNLQMQMVEAVISEKEIKFKGIFTWMKAVAMMTPVPKCLTEKNTAVGILTRWARFATIGNNTPYVNTLSVRGRNTKR